MEAIVDEAFGDVAGFHAVLRLQPVTENYFVHRSSFIGKLVDALQLFANIVGIENRIFRSLPQAIGSIREDISQCAHEHAKVAVEGTHAPNRLRTVVLEPKLAVGARGQHRRGQKPLESLLARNGPRTGTSSAMRRGKGLVQIQVHYI